MLFLCIWLDCALFVCLVLGLLVYCFVGLGLVVYCCCGMLASFNSVAMITVFVYRCCLFLGLLVCCFSCFDVYVGGLGWYCDLWCLLVINLLWFILVAVILCGCVVDLWFSSGWFGGRLLACVLLCLLMMVLLGWFGCVGLDLVVQISDWFGWLVGVVYVGCVTLVVG